MPQIIETEEKEEKKQKFNNSKYTSMIMTKEAKTKIGDFKIEYMHQNKIKHLSDAKLFLKLIEYYEQSGPK